MREAGSAPCDSFDYTELAHQIQARALEVGPHAYVGQWYQPIAHRDDVAGLLHGPAPVFWNVSKGGS